MSLASHPSYQRPCGWLEQPENGLQQPVLMGDHHFDAIVVGGGYTGLAIARRLAELQPDYQIAVLEAERVGTGSPGRNSGFVLETVLAAPDSQRAAKIWPHYQQAHQALSACAGLDEDVSAQHIFKAAATPRGERALKKLADLLDASGQPWQRMDADQLKQITGSQYYRQGVRLEGNRLLNPARLIQSIAQQLPDNIILFENSPALTLEPQQSGWRVTTPSGSARAPRLLLANNAFIKGLGYGQSRSVTIYTYAGITAPLSPTEQQQVCGQGEWGLLPAHRLGTTFRNTEDGRLLVRGMYGYESEGGDEVAAILQRSLSSRFPELAGAQSLEKWWGGTTSLTANGAPLWGELKPGLFASIGCNGVGIVKGWLLGSALAELACGQTTLDVPGLFGRPSWMPPEPFRQLGFLTVSELEKQMAGGEI